MIFSRFPRQRFFSSVSANLVPFIIEKTGAGERSYDIYSRLLKDRIVCLHGGVNPNQASVIIAQLLYLESVDNTKPIHLYINSPGGTVTDGLAIYDTIQYIKSPVHTVAMGLAASMGSFLLAAGAAGHRMALPNARIMLHQPHGGAQGQASDIAIQAQEILYVRRRLNEIYAKHTGKALQVIENALERDYFMSAEEAVQFGIVDKVIEKRE